MKSVISIFFLLSILITIVASKSCNCKIPSVKQAYDNPATKRVIWGTVQYTWLSSDGNFRFAIMQVNRQFKACNFFDSLVNLVVKTPLSGPCALPLVQARSYFVPVQSFEQSSIVSVCKGLKIFSKLSKQDIRYIEGKSPCPKDQGLIKLPSF